MCPVQIWFLAVGFGFARCYVIGNRGDLPKVGTAYLIMDNGGETRPSGAGEEDLLGESEPFWDAEWIDLERRAQDEDYYSDGEESPEDTQTAECRHKHTFHKPIHLSLPSPHGIQFSLPSSSQYSTALPTGNSVIESTWRWPPTDSDQQVYGRTFPDAWSNLGIVESARNLLRVLDVAPRPIPNPHEALIRTPGFEILPAMGIVGPDYNLAIPRISSYRGNVPNYINILRPPGKSKSETPDHAGGTGVDSPLLKTTAKKIYEEKHGEKSNPDPSPGIPEKEEEVVRDAHTLEPIEVIRISSPAQGVDNTPASIIHNDEIKDWLEVRQKAARIDLSMSPKLFILDPGSSENVGAEESTKRLNHRDEEASTDKTPITITGDGYQNVGQTHPKDQSTPLEDPETRGTLPPEQDDTTHSLGNDDGDGLNSIIGGNQLGNLTTPHVSINIDNTKPADQFLTLDGPYVPNELTMLDKNPQIENDSETERNNLMEGQQNTGNVTWSLDKQHNGPQENGPIQSVPTIISDRTSNTGVSEKDPHLNYPKSDDSYLETVNDSVEKQNNKDNQADDKGDTQSEHTEHIPPVDDGLPEEDQTLSSKNGKNEEYYQENIKMVPISQKNNVSSSVQNHESGDVPHGSTDNIHISGKINDPVETAYGHSKMYNSSLTNGEIGLGNSHDGTADTHQTKQLNFSNSTDQMVPQNPTYNSSSNQIVPEAELPQKTFINQESVINTDEKSSAVFPETTEEDLSEHYNDYINSIDPKFLDDQCVHKIDSATYDTQKTHLEYEQRRCDNVKVNRFPAQVQQLSAAAIDNTVPNKTQEQGQQNTFPRVQYDISVDGQYIKSSTNPDETLENTVHQVTDVDSSRSEGLLSVNRDNNVVSEKQINTIPDSLDHIFVDGQYLRINDSVGQSTQGAPIDGELLGLGNEGEKSTNMEGKKLSVIDQNTTNDILESDQSNFKAVPDHISEEGQPVHAVDTKPPVKLERETENSDHAHTNEPGNHYPNEEVIPLDIEATDTLHKIQNNFSGTPDHTITDGQYADDANYSENLNAQGRNSEDELNAGESSSDSDHGETTGTQQHQQTNYRATSSQKYERNMQVNDSTNPNSQTENAENLLGRINNVDKYRSLSDVRASSRTDTNSEKQNDLKDAPDHDFVNGQYVRVIDTTKSVTIVNNSESTGLIDAEENEERLLNGAGTLSSINQGLSIGTSKQDLIDHEQLVDTRAQKLSTFHGVREHMDIDGQNDHKKHSSGSDIQTKYLEHERFGDDNIDKNQPAEQLSAKLHDNKLKNKGEELNFFQRLGYETFLDQPYNIRPSSAEYVTVNGPSPPTGLETNTSSNKKFQNYISVNGQYVQVKNQESGVTGERGFQNIARKQSYPTVAIYRSNGDQSSKNNVDPTTVIHEMEENKNPSNPHYIFVNGQYVQVKKSESTISNARNIYDILREHTNQNDDLIQNVKQTFDINQEGPIHKPMLEHNNLPGPQNYIFVDGQYVLVNNSETANNIARHIQNTDRENSNQYDDLTQTLGDQSTNSHKDVEMEQPKHNLPGPENYIFVDGQYVQVKDSKNTDSKAKDSQGTTGENSNILDILPSIQGKQSSPNYHNVTIETREREPNNNPGNLHYIFVNGQYVLVRDSESKYSDARNINEKLRQHTNQNNDPILNEENQSSDIPVNVAIAQPKQEQNNLPVAGNYIFVDGQYVHVNDSETIYSNSRNVQNIVQNNRNKYYDLTQSSENQSSDSDKDFEMDQPKHNHPGSRNYVFVAGQYVLVNGSENTDSNAKNIQGIARKDSYINDDLPPTTGEHSSEINHNVTVETGEREPNNNANNSHYIFVNGQYVLVRDSESKYSDARNIDDILREHTIQNNYPIFSEGNQSSGIPVNVAIAQPKQEQNNLPGPENYIFVDGQYVHVNGSETTYSNARNIQNTVQNNSNKNYDLTQSSGNQSSDSHKDFEMDQPKHNLPGPQNYIFVAGQYVLVNDSENTDSNAKNIQGIARKDSYINDDLPSTTGEHSSEINHTVTVKTLERKQNNNESNSHYMFVNGQYVLVRDSESKYSDARNINEILREHTNQNNDPILNEENQLSDIPVNVAIAQPKQEQNNLPGPENYIFVDGQYVHVNDSETTYSNARNIQNTVQNNSNKYYDLTQSSENQSSDSHKDFEMDQPKHNLPGPQNYIFVAGQYVLVNDSENTDSNAKNIQGIARKDSYINDDLPSTTGEHSSEINHNVTVETGGREQNNNASNSHYIFVNGQYVLVRDSESKYSDARNINEILRQHTNQNNDPIFSEENQSSGIPVDVAIVQPKQEQNNLPVAGNYIFVDGQYVHVNDSETIYSDSRNVQNTGRENSNQNVDLTQSTGDQSTNSHKDVEMDQLNHNRPQNYIFADGQYVQVNDSENTDSNARNIQIMARDDSHINVGLSNENGEQSCEIHHDFTGEAREREQYNNPGNLRYLFVNGQYVLVTDSESKYSDAGNIVDMLREHINPNDDQTHNEENQSTNIRENVAIDQPKTEQINPPGEHNYIFVDGQYVHINDSENTDTIARNIQSIAREGSNINDDHHDVTVESREREQNKIPGNSHYVFVNGQYVLVMDSGSKNSDAGNIDDILREHTNPNNYDLTHKEGHQSSDTKENVSMSDNKNISCNTNYVFVDGHYVEVNDSETVKNLSRNADDTVVHEFKPNDKLSDRVGDRSSNIYHHGPTEQNYLSGSPKFAFGHYVEVNDAEKINSDTRMIDHIGREESKFDQKLFNSYSEQLRDIKNDANIEAHERQLSNYTLDASEKNLDGFNNTHLFGVDGQGENQFSEILHHLFVDGQYVRISDSESDIQTKILKDAQDNNNADKSRFFSEGESMDLVATPDTQEQERINVPDFSDQINAVGQRSRINDQIYSSLDARNSSDETLDHNSNGEILSPETDIIPSKSAVMSKIVENTGDSELDSDIGEIAGQVSRPNNNLNNAEMIVDHAIVNGQYVREESAQPRLETNALLSEDHALSRAKLDHSQALSGSQPPSNSLGLIGELKLDDFTDSNESPYHEHAAMPGSISDKNNRHLCLKCWDENNSGKNGLEVQYLSGTDFGMNRRLCFPVYIGKDPRVAELAKAGRFVFRIDGQEYPLSWVEECGEGRIDDTGRLGPTLNNAKSSSRRPSRHSDALVDTAFVENGPESQFRELQQYASTQSRKLERPRKQESSNSVGSRCGRTRPNPHIGRTTELAADLVKTIQDIVSPTRTRSHTNLIYL